MCVLGQVKWISHSCSTGGSIGPITGATGTQDGGSDLVLGQKPFSTEGTVSKLNIGGVYRPGFDRLQNRR